MRRSRLLELVFSIWQERDNLRYEFERMAASEGQTERRAQVLTLKHHGATQASARLKSSRPRVNDTCQLV